MPPSHGGDTGSNPVGGIDNVIRGDATATRPGRRAIVVPWTMFGRSSMRVRPSSAIWPPCRGRRSSLLSRCICWSAFLRVRAWQNILRASYPDTRVRYRDVLGAYLAGVGVDSDHAGSRRRPREALSCEAPLSGSEHSDTGVDSSSSRRCSMRSSRAPCSCGRSEQGVLPGVPDLPRLPVVGLDLRDRTSDGRGVHLRLRPPGWRGSSWRARRLRASPPCAGELALGFAALKPP